MIQLRWLHLEGQASLQYRHAIFYMAANGCLAPSDRWTDWLDVSAVDAPVHTPLTGPPPDPT